jgi:type IV pilus assembly protein PilV
MKFSGNRNSARQGGFSLLEVMISVIILAIGVIGIAALQLTTSVYNESSLHRSQAATLAREMVERMRINLDEAKAGNYDITTLPSLTRNCTGSTKNCTPTQMKDHDLRVWSARVTSLLPSANASINTDTSTDPVEITLHLSWDESRGQRTDANCLDSNSTCQDFVFKLFGLGL